MRKDKKSGIKPIVDYDSVTKTNFLIFSSLNRTLTLIRHFSTSKLMKLD